MLQRRGQGNYTKGKFGEDAAENIAEVRLQEAAARERVQELEGERSALEEQVAGLQADVVRGRREQEEAVSSLERQLSDANRQQQMLREELTAAWRKAGMQDTQVGYYMGACMHVYVVFYNI